MSIDYDDVEALAQSSDSVARLAAAAKADDAEILSTLSEDEDVGVRRMAARNISIHLRDLFRLLRDESNFVKMNAACNPVLSGEEISRLDFTDEYIKIGVAENSNIPVEILRRLSKDADSYVRGKVAENRSTPVKVLDELSRDSYALIRLKVADNPETSSMTIFRLYGEGGRVGERAALHPNYDWERYIEEFVSLD